MSAGAPQFRKALIVSATLGVAVMSCGREPAGPDGLNGPVRYSQGIAFKAEFPAGYRAYQLANQATGSGGVAFTTVRIVLRNTDGSVALDTAVSFPVGAEELPLTLSVPLPASAPAGGLPFALSLNYVNAAGETVFTGGPVNVNAVPVVAGRGPPPPSPVDIVLSYTGPGSTAAGVRISPTALTVNTGGTFSFSAQAVDAGGAVVPNTPIVFVSEDGVLANVNAATGAGTAGPTRGSTRIVAQLLTHQEAAATLTIVSPPSSIAAVSGGGQLANVNAVLPQPVIVQVNAADGQPAPGVTVTFAAQHGGSAGTASAITGASGQASTTWRLGNSAGQQTLTATASGLAGSPVSFAATARALDPIRLEILTQPPSSVVAGAAFGIVARAVTSAGEVAPAFTGAVTVALGAGAPAMAALTGTTTVNAVAGIATFTGLGLTVPGAYVLAASNSVLTGATSAGFQIVAGPAARLTFQNYPVAGAVAGTLLDPVTVVARDSFGNQVSSFTGEVSVTVTEPAAAAYREPIASPPRAASALADATATRQGARRAGATTVRSGESARANVIIGATTAIAVGGIATFADLRLTNAGINSLGATSAGLADAIGPTFVVTAGAPAIIQVTSGNGQVATVGAVLPAKIVARLTDAFGNGIIGPTVSFTPAAGSGSANPSSSPAGAGGFVETTWTLGAAPGAQSLALSSTGVANANVTATATGGVVGAVQYGYPVEFPGVSSHSPDYLLGSVISVPSASTLTHLAVIAKSAGPRVRMALYSDLAGAPKTLLASTPPTALVVGVNEFAVSPIALPPGNYWIMGIYEVNAQIGIDFANSDVVKYISLPFGAALPTTFPAPTVYTGQRFNYYIRVN